MPSARLVPAAQTVHLELPKRTLQNHLETTDIVRSEVNSEGTCCVQVTFRTFKPQETLARKQFTL